MQMVKSPLHSHMLTFSKRHLFVKMFIVLWNESALVLESKGANTETWRCQRAIGLSLQGLSQTLQAVGLPHSMALARPVRKPNLARTLSPTADPRLPLHAELCLGYTLCPNRSPLTHIIITGQGSDVHCSTSLSYLPVCSPSMDATAPFSQAYQGANKVLHTIVLSI